MSIEVTCPNGHNLRVKSEFAGKSGLCPFCKTRIEVPQAVAPKPVAKGSSLSEEDLLAVLGPPRRVPKEAASDDSAAWGETASVHSEATMPPLQSPNVHQHRDAAAKKEPAGRPGASIVNRRRVCPKCCEIVSFDQSTCPHCRTSLSEWSFPLPDNAIEKEGRRQMCHFLGLRKQGNVMVIRFGEHSILDEPCVKKLADELFQVAERPDCQNLLLNFTGVVGLSSAMLGVMLLLRKKVSQKEGRLKICFVGPDIMDIFHATKLGQVFQILGNEQQGLKAFE